MTQIQQHVAPKILAAAANGVANMIEHQHGDVDAVFGHARIDTHDLDNPYNEINLNQFCSLFESAANNTGNDNFGLQFGANYEPQRLGPIGYLAINSPTLSAALSSLVRYFPAHQENSVLSLTQDRDVLWLNYEIIDGRIERRRQDAELSLGMFLNIFWHCLGQQWSPLEVHCQHAAPDAPAEHERYFKAPVLFGQRSNSIAFSRKSLDALMPGCDPGLYSVIEPYLRERREFKAIPQDTFPLIRHHIKLAFGNELPTMPYIAECMGMSQTDLQRLLRTQEMNFNDILKSARQELALEYVSRDDVHITEIALALGYSELSAFSRAFRYWTGMSPLRYRRIFLSKSNQKTPIHPPNVKSESCTVKRERDTYP